MRAIIAHATGSDLVELRQQLLGAGLDCALQDCVSWDRLVARVAQDDADLVLIQARDDPNLQWSVVREVRDLAAAPVLAIGPIENERLAKQSRQAGVTIYLDEADLRSELDAILEGLTGKANPTNKRGKVLSVLAPAPGSGGSTVAVNLAGALADAHTREVILLELLHESGNAAMLLNAHPNHTTHDLCQRWGSLDTRSIKSALLEHQSGLTLLVNPIEPSTNEHLNADAVRRICLLARATLPYTVVALDSRIAAAQLEAMRLSDAVVLVVRADVPAVHRARWAVDAAVAEHVPREKFRLVINRWGQPGQLSVEQIEASLKLESATLIPDDPNQVNLATNRGILLHELSRQSKISRRFADLAASLNGGQQKRQSLWSWLR